MTTESNKSFLQKEDDCLHRSVKISFVYLYPELFQMMYRKNVIQTVAKLADVVSVHAVGVGVVPLAKLAARDETDADTLDIHDVQQQSQRNLRLLNSCGVDILHVDAGQYCLQEFESSSLFSSFQNKKKLGGPLSHVTPQALAVLKFCFSYVAPWALFCPDVMAKDSALPQTVVISRDSSLKGLTERAELLWKNCQSATLFVKHDPRCGATTLVRHFAWNTAFSKWKAVVIFATEQFNACTAAGFDSCARVLRHVTHSAHPVILIADRNISDAAVERFCSSLTSVEVNVLLIRLMRKTQDSGQTSQWSIGKKEQAFIVAPNENEIRRVGVAMLQVAKYFDPTILVKEDVDFFKMGATRFNKIFFLGVLDFASSHSRTSLSLTPEQKARDALYGSILNNWMTGVLDNLYARINAEGSAGGPRSLYTSMSAVRALCYLAIVQLCWPEGNGIDIDSFQFVFDDPSSSMWLFEAWQHGNVEGALLKASCGRLLKEKLSTMFRNSTQIWGSLLPFRELLSGDVTLLSPKGAAEHKPVAAATDDDAFPALSAKGGPAGAGAAQSKKEAGDPSAESKAEPKAVAAADDDSALTAAAAVAAAVKIPQREEREFDFDPIDQFVAMRRDALSRVGLASSADDAAPNKKRAIKPPASSLQGLFKSLLQASPTPARAGGTDVLDDLEDMLWSEFLVYKNGRLRFFSTDIAEIFLKVALAKESAKTPSAIPAAAVDEVNQFHYYVLCMSLLHSIFKNNDQLNYVDGMSSVDIYNRRVGEEEDFSLAWQCLHMFTERQYCFANPGGDTAYRNQKWSWALVNVHSSSTAQPPLFEFNEMKLLLASQAVFFGHWRLSSTTIRLMQFRNLTLTRYLSNLRESLERDSTGELTYEMLYKAARNVFVSGVKLFFASSGRTLLAFDQINRKEEDRKKYAGTLEMLGNCAKSFVYLTRMFLKIKLQEELDKPVVHPTDLRFQG
jgi:hypothetical protein